MSEKQFPYLMSPETIADAVNKNLEFATFAREEITRLLWRTADFATATSEVALKFSEDLRSRLLASDSDVKALAQGMNDLLCDLPKDPVAFGQKVLALTLDGSQKLMDLNVAAARGLLGLGETLVSRAEQAAK
ncbi:MAG: hypothetical protein HYY53_02620, partial [candidate division NC10 bacterium]|nr:hypothetical protein [candidate division NC10 bacterium]